MLLLGLIYVALFFIVCLMCICQWLREINSNEFIANFMESPRSHFMLSFFSRMALLALFYCHRFVPTAIVFIAHFHWPPPAFNENQ